MVNNKIRKGLAAIKNVGQLLIVASINEKIPDAFAYGNQELRKLLSNVNEVMADFVEKFGSSNYDIEVLFGELNKILNYGYADDPEWKELQLQYLEADLGLYKKLLFQDRGSINEAIKEIFARAEFEKLLMKVVGAEERVLTRAQAMNYDNYVEIYLQLLPRASQKLLNLVFLTK